MPFQADHTFDVNRSQLVPLYQQYEFPVFVKKANLDEAMAPRARAERNYFADPVRHQFPCDTAVSTWLSALYYQEKHAEFHPKDRVKIEANLEKYADYWRIRPNLDYIRRRWQELHKTAEDQLPDTAYALVWVDNETGRKDRHLRMTSAAEVKAAAEYVEKYRDHFPFEVRHTMARKILEKAAQFGASVGGQREFLEKQAGMGVCDPAEVVQMIENRARAVREPMLQETFRKMARTVRDMPRKALHPDSLVKLASTLDTLDRNLNLTHRYAEGMPRPEDVLFKATFSKVASELHQHVAFTTGRVYEKQSFAKLALADVQSLFGDDFADRVRTPLGEVDPEKMAEEASTLPRPDAEMLDALLGDQGITPVLHKAASVRQGLAKVEQEAWAKAYATAR